MCIRQTALAAILLLVFIPALHAKEQLFRCVQANGHLSFQKTRCAGEGSSIEVAAVQGGWVSLRPGEKTLLKFYRQRDAKRRQGRRKVAKKSKPVEDASCWKKRKQLDAVGRKLRRGYKASQGEGLRLRRKNYTEYLKKFCRK